METANKVPNDTRPSRQPATVNIPQSVPFQRPTTTINTQKPITKFRTGNQPATLDILRTTLPYKTPESTTITSVKSETTPVATPQTVSLNFYLSPQSWLIRVPTFERILKIIGKIMHIALIIKIPEILDRLSEK